MSGEAKYWNEEVRRSIGDCSRRKSLALMPLSALFDARVYVGEAKGLRWEERGIA